MDQYFFDKRDGLDGKIFECYKFRTMYVDTAEKTKIVKQTTKNDQE